MTDNGKSGECKRCGRCMDVCPIYQVTLREADVARGKLSLLEELEGHHLDPSRGLARILSRCLLCGRCTAVCANEVRTSREIQAGRKALCDAGKAQGSGYALAGRLARTAPPGNLLRKGGALLQALVCRRIPESSGLHLRFPFSLFSSRATVPEIAQESFLETWRAPRPEAGAGMRVVFFVGCGANYLFPEIGWALVRLLARHGIGVIVPQDQVCCGLPAWAAGDTEKARHLAKRNIEALNASGADIILTACASCGAHLRRLGELFRPGSRWRREAEILTAKHREAVSFLVQTREPQQRAHSPQRAVAEAAMARRRLAGGNLQFDASGERSGGKGDPHRPIRRVAYHEPCHLKDGGGSAATYKRLLETTPGLRFVEPAGPGRCCGHGGGFNIAHFELSMEILAGRMAQFEAAQPDVITTSCTGCLLQLMEGAARKWEGRRIEVCHPLVLVDRVIAAL